MINNIYKIEMLSDFKNDESRCNKGRLDENNELRLYVCVRVGGGAFLFYAIFLFLV